MMNKNGRNSGFNGDLLLLMEDILHQLVGSLSDYLRGFIDNRWLFGIFSINSMLENKK